jgi:2-iminobutanoate/2-iminopropanoate deaminase
MKEIIKTENAPAAVGPYSQGVKIKGGNLIFCSGQIALDPKTGQIVGQTAAEQAEQVLKNLTAVLAAGGAGPANIVKTTIYIVDMGEFAAVNEVYGRFFKSEMPARATVEVRRLPKDAKIQIEAIAVI